MRVMLFDWTAGGHHAGYLTRFAAELAGFCDLEIAAPSAMRAISTTFGAAHIDLGDPKPGVGSLRRERRRVAERELDLMARAVASSRPDHVIHLNGDPIIRMLTGRPCSSAATSIVIFRPRAHVPEFYGDRLAPEELMRAYALERFVSRWRARRDASRIWTLDEAAAARWNTQSGAPAAWLPEPYVQPPVTAPEGRLGLLLYGALAPRKGLDRLAAAVGAGGIARHVVLAGPVEPGFRTGVPAPRCCHACGWCRSRGSRGPIQRLRDCV